VTIEGTAFADSGYLKLPNPDFIDLDDDDRARLSEEIGLKGELARLVLDYVLCTLSESMRLVCDNVPRNAPRAKRLLFRHFSRVQYADAKWDILTLVRQCPPFVSVSQCADFFFFFFAFSADSRETNQILTRW